VVEKGLAAHRLGIAYAVARAAVVGIFLTTLSAYAEAISPQGIAFDLERGEGAESCPDHDTLAARVDRRVAQGQGSPGVPVADSVAIAITQSEGGYVATVSVLGAEGGTRRLVDNNQDCAGLAEALTLTLAMIADGRPLSATVSLDKPAPVRTPRPWEVGAGVLGSTGILGAASLGYSLDVVWHPWPRVAAGVTALWMPSRKIERAPGLSKVSVEAGLASLCWGILPFGGRFFPAMCGRFGAGVLQGEGEGYDNNKSVIRPWLVAGGTLDVGIRIHRRLTLAVHAGRLFSLRDEDFTLGGLGSPVYGSGHPGWVAGMGLQVRIP
jgi:hypothetical protein